MSWGDLLRIVTGRETQMATWFGRSLSKARNRRRLPGRQARKRSLRQVLHAEALEDRWLPSLTPALLLDINLGSAASNPASFTPVSDRVFFTASDGANGVELWLTNGTPAGTFLVQDINPGSGNSTPKYLTNVNGTLFFSA